MPKPDPQLEKIANYHRFKTGATRDHHPGFTSLSLEAWGLIYVVTAIVVALLLYTVAQAERLTTDSTDFRREESVKSVQSADSASDRPHVVAAPALGTFGRRPHGADKRASVRPVSGRITPVLNRCHTDCTSSNRPHGHSIFFNNGPSAYTGTSARVVGLVRAVRGSAIRETSKRRNVETEEHHHET